MFAGHVRRFLREEDGPSAVEYAVMLALILTVAVVAISSFGNSSSGFWAKDKTSIGGALQAAPS